tara:strand:- start:117 stop:317 length:201 start_codon:yes stop_codon:yes gene_type:complete
MTLAAREENWNHTAYLMSLLHNVNCAQQSDMKDYKHFHPMHELPKPKRIEALKDLFLNTKDHKMHK